MKSLDNPQTTINRIAILEKKTLLNNVYRGFYIRIKKHLVKIPKGKVVELGSGAGFIKEIIPNIVTTDIMDLPNVDISKVNAEKLPFGDKSLSGLVMLNVFHHISDPKRALSEFERVLKKGGRVVMIEPWNTPWSKFIYQNFHHEAFDTVAKWKSKPSGPLSGGNDALPWIVFERDRDIFNNNFSNLSLERIEIHTPIKYLLSGGFSKPTLVPKFLYGLVSLIEKRTSRVNKYVGMFATIKLVKR